ncbi:hypothetical protein SAMN05216238_103102 [Lentibacillus persicus]|uniref:YcxB-like protein n=1 Tax=Lentibacillus persicus TaxID=640948 RepID=A0A1I1U9V0_9BACI|nr:hypothetical protein [Lentibacillus persicus]SFD67537.1 hypothetical protein SAMN05216238_103102 [Lentibacillus persicus]
MSFKYANHEKWLKQSLKSFGNAAVFILVLVVEALLNGQLHPIILISTAAVFLFSVFRGFDYIMREQRDYIRVDDNIMSIDRGSLVLPRRKIRAESIERYIDYDPQLILKLRNEEDTQVNTDWLSDEAVSYVKQYLNNKLDANQT